MTAKIIVIIINCVSKSRDKVSSYQRKTITKSGIQKHPHLNHTLYLHYIVTLIQ